MLAVGRSDARNPVRIVVACYTPAWDQVQRWQERHFALDAVTTQRGHELGMIERTERDEDVAAADILEGERCPAVGAEPAIDVCRALKALGFTARPAKRLEV